MNKERLGKEFNVSKFDFNGYKIGTYVFDCREIKKDGQKFVEVSVYKYSDPVILYIKTFKAPFLDGATDIDLCEALYEEFYEKEDK